MTPDIKGLVERLRGFAARHYNAERVQMASDAADALEAMARDVARLNAECCRCGQPTTALCKAAQSAESERDRLKAALQPFSDAYERLVRTQESMGFSDNATFGLGIKVSAIKVARKVLGGDA